MIAQKTSLKVCGDVSDLQRQGVESILGQGISPERPLNPVGDSDRCRKRVPPTSTKWRIVAPPPLNQLPVPVSAMLRVPCVQIREVMEIVEPESARLGIVPILGRLYIPDNIQKSKSCWPNHGRPGFHGLNPLGRGLAQGRSRTKIRTWSDEPDSSCSDELAEPKVTNRVQKSQCSQQVSTLGSRPQQPRRRLTLVSRSRYGLVKPGYSFAKHTIRPSRAEAMAPKDARVTFTSSESSMGGSPPCSTNSKNLAISEL